MLQCQPELWDRRPVSSSVFADEHREGGFRFAAVAIASAEVSRARAAMRRQLPSGTRRLHFVKEHDRNRRQALAAIERIPFRAVIVEAPTALPPAEQRARALATLVHWAVVNGATRIVLERDENRVATDRRIIGTTLARLKPAQEVSYLHSPPTVEPLLWIPDAIAWCWMRGGEWRQRVEAMGVTRIDA
jgi:hypothetical protein